MSTPPPVFSLVVLAYGAGETVVPFTESLHRTVGATGLPFELVLVANYWAGSDDTTPDVARRLAERLAGVVVVAEPKRGAMGWDMRTGLAACRGDLLGVIDGDGQFPVDVIADCLTRLQTPGVDMVKTFRTSRGDGIYRRMLSATYNRIFTLMFPTMRGIRDANSKPKLMTRETYESMVLTADDWFIDAEIMLEAKRHDRVIVEVPVEFSALDDRKSFVRPQAVAEFCVNLVKARWRRR